jgi:hypothetical protein
MKSFSLQALHQVAPSRLPGYLEAVLAVATVQRGRVWMKEEDYERILRQFNPEAVSIEPALPGRAAMARNATQAIVDIGLHALKTGRILRTSEALAAVQRICRGDPAKGLPKCEFLRSDDRCAKCGCKFGRLLFDKWKYEAQHCPLNKW